MEQYLIYLRKSRADRDAELRGEGDTLSRHRTALLALAKSKNLSIAGIFEEVVSGETISARPEMQKLLRLVETGDYAGVLVVEVERLARGNTRDQGIVAETFQYSSTKIVTLSKTYDPSSESDQEYFEFGLFMSRREYKTINRRLQRGRSASLSEGKYIAGSAPYGYERVKLVKQKGYSLKIIPEQADVIRHIFSLYVHGELQSDGTVKTYGTSIIAKRLDEEGILSPSGGKWPPCTIKDIIINPTYAGKIRWSYRPTVRSMKNGDIVITRPVNKNVEFVDGLHSPIVSLELFEQAGLILSSRSNAPVPSSTQIKNPLAGLIFCAHCGRRLVRSQVSHGKGMLLCPNKDCTVKGSLLCDVESSVLDSLRIWLAEYKLQRSDSSSKSDIPSNLLDAQRTVTRLTSLISTLSTQKSSLYDLLEQGVYTQDVFLSRSSILSEKISNAEASLSSANSVLSSLSSISCQQNHVIPNIERVLANYSDLQTPKEKNDLLKEVIEKVIYEKTEGSRWIPSNMSLYLFPKFN